MNFIDKLLPTQNLHLAKQHFDSLPESDLNRKFYNGLIYSKPTNVISKAFNLFTLQSKLHTLTSFYPHHRQISETHANFHE